MYKTWADGQVLSAADMTAVTSDPVQGDVATSQTTTSSSYTDLSTVGPTATVTLTVGQTVLIVYSANVSSSSTAAAARIAYAVSGASTVAASDNDSANTANTDALTTGMVAVYTATVAGSHTFTLKYRTGGGVTGTYSTRRIVVKKF